MFAAYVGDKGRAFYDRRLYLPKADVLEAVRFAIKPRLAAGMITRAVAAGMPFA